MAKHQKTGRLVKFKGAIPDTLPIHLYDHLPTIPLNFMSKYKMEDGTIVDTKKAAAKWDEGTYWNGNNHISRATGSQWNHETLYRSSKGRYYIVSGSQWQGSTDSARFVTDEEAASWLSLMSHEIPEDLYEAANAMME